MFKKFVQDLRSLRTDQRGVTIIEYALLAGLVGVALTVALTTLKNSISTTLSTIGTSL